MEWVETTRWRRERDSNPRDGCPPTRVPGVRLQPLGHLSLTKARTIQEHARTASEHAFAHESEATRLLTAAARAPISRADAGTGRRTTRSHGMMIALRILGGFAIIAAVIALVNDVTHSFDTGAKFAFASLG